MINPYKMRSEFNLRDYNTAITRKDFEKHFTKTREKVRFTFNGWDGASYHGEMDLSRKVQSGNAQSLELDEI